MMKASDFILTHSTEGVEFAGQYGSKVKARTKFLHHPLQPADFLQTSQKTTDILVWGSIIPYKGIDLFLEYLRLTKLDMKWHIRIVGKISDLLYEEKIRAYANEKIVIENKFLNHALLKHEIASSRYVLYTYLKDSVLSSGAVMDSLSLGAKVIGPSCGAFSDLQNDGVIDTYSDYNELTSKLLAPDGIPAGIHNQKLLRFIEEHSWKSFGKKIATWLSFFK